MKTEISKYDIALFAEKIKSADRIAISGHIHPDGDCIGSCLGLKNYISDLFKDKTVDVYLEQISEDFTFLRFSENILYLDENDEVPFYPLFICLDCSEPSRLGRHQELMTKADFTVCIDHHFTNVGFGDLAFIDPHASSTSEILYKIFDYDRIGLETAQSLYLGLVHDTGVFKHSNTTHFVMDAAGSLLDKGVRSEFIIDHTFYNKTFKQNKILGRALLNSRQLLDGDFIVSVVTQDEMAEFGTGPADMDGIIDQLRVTEGSKCAMLLYETAKGVYKASLRSSSHIDVSKIALKYGGGGHIKAAGCTIYSKNTEHIIEEISKYVAEQL